MKQLFLFLCLHIFTCLYAQSQSDIIINEVMANPKGLICFQKPNISNCTTPQNRPFH